MARRFAGLHLLRATVGLLGVTFLIWLAVYPVPPSAESAGIPQDELDELSSASIVLPVTPTQVITKAMPANPWHPAFIETQAGQMKTSPLPGKPGTGTPGGWSPQSTPPITAIKTLTREIESRSETYSVTVDGTLDPNNVYLRIENVGTTVIVNPKITVNGKDWSTIDGILAQVIETDMSAAEKARAIWEFARTGRYHWWTPTQQTSEVTDPVKLFNAYGYGFCTDIALAMGALFDAVGLPSRFWIIGAPGQHDISEAWYDGGWHMLEADRDGLYLKRDNRTVAGVEDLIQDPTLVARAGQMHSDLVAIYANTPEDANWPAQARYEVGHEISMTLRPQEALVLAWQTGGLFHNDTGWDYPAPPEYANGQIISPLDLTDPGYRQWIVGESSVRSQTDDGQWPVLSPLTHSIPAELVYGLDSPYPIVGITLTADFYRQNPTDRLEIYVSRYPDAIELLGPDIGDNLYLLPGLYFDSSNIASHADDGAWPPLHAAMGLQPAYLTYRLTPKTEPGTRVVFGGRFYRYQSSDVVAMSISTDGVNWQLVWQGTELGYFDHDEDVTALVAGSSSFYARYELLAQSLNSIYGGWTAALMEIKIQGVEGPDDQLAWSAADSDGLGIFSTDVNLTPWIARVPLSAAYHYLVKFVMESSEAPLSVGLNGFTLTTVIQIAPRSLPALALGVNEVQYSDDSSGPVNTAVTHHWIESDGWHLPLAPAAPEYPADGAIVAMNQPVTFTWQPSLNPDGDDIYQYHVEICDRPDCRWPLSSIFDTDMIYFDRVLWQWILNSSSSWLMPYVDWLNPGQTYYWRVKAQDVRALWSEYSSTWSFTVAEVPLSGLNIVTDAVIPFGMPSTFSATVQAGSHVTYTWNFGDGTAATGAVVSHTYASPGQHTVGLTATNPVGVITAAKVSNVQLPVAKLGTSGGGTLKLGEAAVLTATAGSGTSISYSWSFGDGLYGTGAVVTHAYAAGGNYLAIVTATNLINSLESVVPVTVLNPRPVVRSLEIVSAGPGDLNYLLDIRGGNFVPESQLVVNGTPRPATLVSSEQMQMERFEASGAASEPITVSVLNPPPGGGLSNLIIHQADYFIWLPMIR